MASASDGFGTPSTPPTNWVTPGGLGSLTAGSGQVAGNGATDNMGYYDGGLTWANDHESTVEIVTGATNPDGGPMVRVGNDGSSLGQGYGYDATAGQLFKYLTGNTYTGLEAGGARTVTLSVGDTLKLRATGASPTTLKLFKNGVQVGADLTDSTAGLQSGGAPGIFIFGNAATEHFDNWVGADVVAGGGGGTVTSPYFFKRSRANAA